MNKNFFVKNLKSVSFCFVLLNFIFVSNVYSQNQEKSIITIESAQSSEYKKDKETKDDLIILSGNVKISVQKGSSKTTIYSDNVNYNRKTEMIFAEGNVVLEQSGGSSSSETIHASTLLFNTSTLEGVFDNARVIQSSSDALNLPTGSTLIVSSEVFGRDSGGTIAFKSGELTFCDDENPHWKIKASRIWLLPGGEFAFLNALLYVGRIPLMYFPAFYYPKDELIFNPAFGFKYREGYFINTTTYLYGRKGSDAPSTKKTSSDDTEKLDLFSFMNTGKLKKQVREGIVLHNLDEDFTGDTTNYIKLMADYYSNLGAMVGIDSVLKPKKILNDFAFNAELGFSNTLFETDSGYLPYDTTTGEKVYDKSNFLSMELPFRYKANLKMSISKPLSLNLSIPIYSDPYFSYDFDNRAETMDWIDYLMSSNTKSDEDEDPTTISSFTWQLNGSYTFKLPEVLKKAISTLSVSSFSSSVVFSSKNNSNYSSSSNSPERAFYYPSQITPFKIGLRLSGTIFEYPSTKKSTSQNANISLIAPKEIDSSLKNEETQNTEKDSLQSQNKEIAGEKEILPLEESALPNIAISSPSIKNLNGLTYKLSYSISPDFNSQISYSSSNLSTPQDFEWNNIQSTYIQFKSPTTLTSALGLKDGFLSLTDTFNFNPVYQSHPYISLDSENGGYTETSSASIKKADYNARKLDLTDTNALTFKPFYYTKYFSSTSLTWNTTIKMIQTKYISDDVNEPEWEYLTTDLTDEDCFTTHNLNLNLAATEGDYSQSLSLTTTLPPQVDQYNGKLNLTFPYASFSVGSGIKQKSSTDDTWVKQNLSESFSLKLFNNKLSLTQSYVYNFEEKVHDSLRFSLSGFGTQLAYTMSYSTQYEFTSSGWKAVNNSEKEFKPYSLSLAYTSGTKTFKYLAEKITFSPSLSTSVVYDFVRPTNSYFVFIPTITFKVNNLLNISFSSESRNSAIYRYFCSDEEFADKYKTGYRNPFEDLIDSFRFDSDDKRKASNFKMKNLKVTVTHDLDDWDLSAECTIKPRYISSSKSYSFDPYFSISVSWRPMSGMKTEILDKYGEWSLQ